MAQIHDWRIYLRDGEQFLGCARGACKKKKRTFNNEIIYNLACMAIEKLIMAFLMKHGDLAENHTMIDLHTALQRHLGDLPGLAEKFSYLSSFQEICEMETYVTRIPKESDVAQFIAIGEEIKTLLAPHFYEN